jgi:large subunit ribosomal protein L4
MAEAPVIGGSAARGVALDERVFGARFHPSLVHESVRAELAARRRGTAATRTRGMVSGGGSKPWRQKGTGRARAGSNRSPLWRSGGVVFGPQPRSYTFKVNRRERRAALRCALSLHAQRGSLAVLDGEAIPEPSTARALELIDGWSDARPTLVVLTGEATAPMLSFRNLVGVDVLQPEDVGVADVVRAATLLLSEGALESLTERAGDSARRGGAARPAEEARARSASAARKGAAA